MKLKEITVGLSETHSLPEYNNIKPSVSYTAVVEEGDDPNAILLDLRNNCRLYVEAQIDTTRERRGLPAWYSDERRVNLRECKAMNIVFLTPHGIEPSGAPGDVHLLCIPLNHDLPLNSLGNVHIKPDNQRFSYAYDHIREYAMLHNVEFFDWSNLLGAEIIAAEMWGILDDRGAWARVEMVHSQYYGYEKISSKIYAFIMPADVARQYLSQIVEPGDFDRSDFTYFDSLELTEAACKNPRYNRVWIARTIEGLQEMLAHANAANSVEEQVEE